VKQGSNLRSFEPVPETGALNLSAIHACDLGLAMYFYMLGFVFRSTVVALRSHRRGLHVVTAQVLLEVEDGQVVRLRESQELAQRGIGLDGLLIHQVVGLGVGHDTLGHLRARERGTLGLTQEGAELIRHLHGLREDAVSGVGTSSLGGLVLATLALGLLGDARGLLLDGLAEGGNLRVQGLEGGNLLVQLGDRLVEGRDDVILSGSHLRSGGGSSNRCSNRRGLNGGCSLGGLLAHLGLHNGRGSGGNRGNGLGLCGGLLGRLSGSGGHLRAHFGGISGGHGTRYASPGTGDRTQSTLVPAPPKLLPPLRWPGDFYD
jgi:hypothetical protein